MEKLMAFLSSFASYLFLMLVIIVVAALGFIVGRIIRKALDKKKAATEEITETSASDK